MGLENLHRCAHDMENKNYTHLLPIFELEAHEQDLNEDCVDKEKIIAGERQVRRPEEARGDDRGQHQPTEQAGPGLLEAEIKEFREKKFEARA